VFRSTADARVGVRLFNEWDERRAEEIAMMLMRGCFDRYGIAWGTLSALGSGSPPNANTQDGPVPRLILRFFLRHSFQQRIRLILSLAYAFTRTTIEVLLAGVTAYAHDQQSSGISGCRDQD